jgi:hypothetical protein
MSRGSDNHGRSIAIHTLEKTITALKSTDGVTELAFKEAWLAELRAYPEIIASGWYCPPPDGVTVLAAKPESAERLAYSSLRSPENWPSDQVIDWQDGFLMAYCCPIDRATGLAGDVAVTLYFGSDSYVRRYFTRAHSVLYRLLRSIKIDDSSSTLIQRADKMLADEDLRSHVTSITDMAGYNIGHTIPILPPASLGISLTDEDRERCRCQRRFVNSADEWRLMGAGQFSIEPQIRSATDPTLPQLTLHYLVRIEQEGVLVKRDVDSLLFKYGVAQ